MTKRKTELHTQAWAMDVISFARGDRPGLDGYCLEANRVVATDGHRLAWQEFTPALESDAYRGLIDGEGKPVEGEFPDYKAVLPGTPNVIFQVCPDGDWLPALKTLSKLHKRPLGELSYDGRELSVSLKTKTLPVVNAALQIPVTAGDPKPFRVGMDLRYLFEAIDGARRADTRGRWWARVAIVDHVSPIVIDTESGYYSITMPCADRDGFVTKAKNQQAA